MTRQRGAGSGERGVGRHFAICLVRCALCLCALAGPAWGQDITTGLLADWICDDNEVDDTQVADHASGNYHAELQGGDFTAAKSDAGPGGSRPLSLHLNGSDDFVESGFTDIGVVDFFADADPWSVAAWAKVDVSHSGNIVAKAGATQANRTLQVFTAASDAQRYGILLRGSTITYFNRTLAFAQAWRHLCLTWNGTTSTFYIDGVSAGTCSVGTAAIEASETFKFGARTNAVPAVFFDGSLADVRVYSRALAANDVLALYGLQFGRGPFRSTAVNSKQLTTGLIR